MGETQYREVARVGDPSDRDQAARARVERSHLQFLARLMAKEIVEQMVPENEEGRDRQTSAATPPLTEKVG